MDHGNLATVERMWRREVEAAHTYKLLAARESDPKRAAILLRLAELLEAGGDAPSAQVLREIGRASCRERVCNDV